MATLVALGACQPKGDDTADSASSECAERNVTWANYGNRFFRTYCNACHGADSPDRHDAPESMVFDTRQDVADRVTLVRNSVLVDQTMPVGGGVYDDDLELLDVLLTCEFGG